MKSKIAYVYAITVLLTLYACYGLTPIFIICLLNNRRKLIRTCYIVVIIKTSVFVCISSKNDCFREFYTCNDTNFNMQVEKKTKLVEHQRNRFLYAIHISVHEVSLRIYRNSLTRIYGYLSFLRLGLKLFIFCKCNRGFLSRSVSQLPSYEVLILTLKLTSL